MAEKEEPRPTFGNRFLVDNSKVFEHNAWDNVEWDKEQEETAIKVVQENTSIKLPTEVQEKYNCEADQYWNSFYMQHNNRFFKDRHWLFTEFSELADTSTISHDKSSYETDGDNENKAPQCNFEITEYPGWKAKKRILEVGCGVGNTVFPILEVNNDPELFVYCCDFSSVAIDLVKGHEEYGKGRCHGFVCDITQANNFPFPYESLDIILLIFVLSAIHPDKFKEAIQRLVKVYQAGSRRRYGEEASSPGSSEHLKPGGRILFRDYGRYDMAQLRFKKGKCLADNFYVRGDGTRCYFFTQEEIRKLFTQEGLVEEQNYVDRRLQVNRGRQLKMYRIWIQGKYRKPKQKTLISKVLNPVLLYYRWCKVHDRKLLMKMWSELYCNVFDRVDHLGSTASHCVWFCPNGNTPHFGHKSYPTICSIICNDWFLNFLSNIFQRVKLSNDCFSEQGSVCSGVLREPNLTLGSSFL